MTTQKNGKAGHWLKLTLIVLGFLVISIGLGYLVRFFLANYQIPVQIELWKALLIVSGILLVINLSVFPLPFGLAIMLVAASHWNPILVALAGSIGASLGECNSYFFGYLGKRIAVNENTPGYKMTQGWINKYGLWAIALLSFQPVLPFEIGGFLAGLAHMPFLKFLPAILIGKFPKYLILIYLGNAVIHLFPSPRLG